MRWALGLIGHTFAYRVEAALRTARFVREAQPAPMLVALLDWCVPDDGPARPAHLRHLWDENDTAKAVARCSWYAAVGELRRDGIAFVHLRPLRERVDWTFRAFDRTPSRRDASEWGGRPAGSDAPGPCHWGKQTLLEAAMDAKADRALLLHVGSWLPPHAPEALERALTGDVAMSYPAAFLRGDALGEPLVPHEGLVNRPRLTAAHLGAGLKVSGDGWWVDLEKLRRGDAGRVCNFGAGDDLATLRRVLRVGEAARAEGVIGGRADLPPESREARVRASKPEDSPAVQEMRLRSLRRALASEVRADEPSAGS